MVEIQTNGLINRNDSDVNQLLLWQGDHMGYRKHPPTIISVDRIEGPQLPWNNAAQSHSLLQGTFDRLGEELPFVKECPWQTFRPTPIHDRDAQSFISHCQQRRVDCDRRPRVVSQSFATFISPTGHVYIKAELR